MYWGFGEGGKKEEDWQQMLAQGQSSSPKKKKKERKKERKGTGVLQVQDASLAPAPCSVSLLPRDDSAHSGASLGRPLLSRIVGAATPTGRARSPDPQMVQGRGSWAQRGRLAAGANSPGRLGPWLPCRSSHRRWE